MMVSLFRRHTDIPHRSVTAPAAGTPQPVPVSILCLLMLALVACRPAGIGVPKPEAHTPSKPPVMVIGFVGGFIRHDNLAHGGVQLAAQLRKDYPAGVYVRVFENRHSEDAHKEVLRLLDANHDGKLSEEEKQMARIIIYGHSWGGSETVALAKKLQSDGIPVVLTIQVDSVAKIGEDDSVIPSNVAQAVNYYQANGIVHGRHQIRAADPARTRIIGNYRFDYSSRSLQCPGYPWYAYGFEYYHIAIECDPGVLSQVESLIRSKLPAQTPTTRASVAH